MFINEETSYRALKPGETTIKVLKVEFGCIKWKIDDNGHVRVGCYWHPIGELDYEIKIFSIR